VQIQGSHENVVALPGDASDDAIALVAAHYDSVPDCPGADDNASGLAVMLECARLLTSVRPPHSVGFIAFNAEEEGLLGSADFVDNGMKALGFKVQVVHVLEMVGLRRNSGVQDLPIPGIPAHLRVPDFLGLVARNESNVAIDLALGSVAAPGVRVLGAKTCGPLIHLGPDSLRSDHAPFWNAGVPAVLWTDTANFRNPHYHQATDTPDTLDYSFMQGVGHLLCDVVTRPEKP
jgi:Zn-dependent M28 family amino/carboxypeptidase